MTTHPSAPKPAARVLQILLGASLVALIASCAAPKSGLGAYQAYDLPTSLPQNPERVRVKVSLNKQRTYVLEGDRLLLAMPVSVGKAGSETPQGSFRILSKNRFYRANTHGFAYRGDEVKRIWRSNLPSGWKFKGTPMPYWCEFKSAYGFHTGWVKHRPCTHGCIRMHENLAPKFFNLVQPGTPVHIARNQPEDAKYGDIPLPPDAGPLPDYGTSTYLGDGYFKLHKAPVYSKNR